MIWTKEKSKSFNTFKQCYEEVLKPGNKYPSSLDATKTRFFEAPKTTDENDAEESFYDLLKRLETNYVGCSSICNKQPFFLTQDISKGMPEFECISKAMEAANATANSTGVFTVILGATVFISLFFAFGVCT